MNSNKTKHVLVENELKKIQAFDSSYFRGKNHFEDDGTQNYLVFQPMYKYFKKIGNTDHISSWESKRLSDEIIKLPTASNNILVPKLKYTGKRMYVNFNRSCLKQDKITLNHGKTVNIIVFDLKSTLNYNENITLENCFFGVANSTKSADINKHKYFGYGIGFDGHGTFSFPSSGFGQNIIIFGVNISSSVHTYSRKNKIS